MSRIRLQANAVTGGEEDRNNPEADSGDSYAAADGGIVGVALGCGMDLIDGNGNMHCRALARNAGDGK